MYKYLKWTTRQHDCKKVIQISDKTIYTEEEAIELQEELTTLLGPVVKLQCSDGLDALADLWRKRWGNLLEMSKKHGERLEYVKAQECRTQAHVFIDAAKELKERLGN
jgi:hypothetical protein